LFVGRLQAVFQTLRLTVKYTKRELIEDGATS
jgi:hypothetical protein